MQHIMAQSRAWAAIWSLSGSRTDQTRRHSRLVGRCGRGNVGGRQDTETPGHFATQGPDLHSRTAYFFTALPLPCYGNGWDRWCQMQADTAAGQRALKRASSHLYPVLRSWVSTSLKHWPGLVLGCGPFGSSCCSPLLIPATLHLTSAT
ncbi:hypothetical protein CMEL01_00664 [Colletotrichum melonis]|uniref:Uncharacterized protein n=1 Tax=Colletotrichum melonis TaxID=1209925 RepID=A0AAI9Y2Z5_9PEZI|nr:hypothetical protein CMEL01_00664 [Colletotrichum melonis]